MLNHNDLVYVLREAVSWYENGECTHEAKPWPEVAKEILTELQNNELPAIQILNEIESYLRVAHFRDKGLDKIMSKYYAKD